MQFTKGNKTDYKGERFFYVPGYCLFFCTLLYCDDGRARYETSSHAFCRHIQTNIPLMFSEIT